jgi:carbon storage regulator
MLVLSRKNGESIRIGQEIEVTILEVSRGRVKVGISGPSEIPIHRSEVYQQIVRCSAAPQAGAALQAVGRGGDSLARRTLNRSTMPVAS